jgi:hypothetical protein
MAREDKASATGSTQDAPSGKSGDQDSSLAARRARLRGTLAKQSTPPDAYSPDPYQLAATPAGVPGIEPVELEPAIAPETNTGNGNGVPANYDPSAAPSPPAGMILEPVEEEMTEVSTMAAPTKSTRGSGKNSGEASPPVIDEPSDVSAVENQFPDFSKMAAPTGAIPAFPANPFSVSAPAPAPVQGPAHYPAANAVPSDFGTNVSPADISVGADHGFGTPTVAHAPVDNAQQGQIIQLLNNLDEQLGICSVNMAQISKVASEQLEIVRNLAETIQHQAFNEIGLSLNSLSESMSAALEPMQAVGELVPAIDNLVTTLESKSNNEPQREANLTPEELVHSLADQLSTGLIDPWTFKCAYMAVFPSEHPADLLRKLVDLLGAQRISGDFFRAAYDAVQAPDPPRPAYTLASSDNVREVEVVRVVQDESVLAQIEELRQQNEEMRARMDAREGDFAELIAAKDQEVQDTQEMLNSRWEEFSSQYEKLSDLVQQRNDLIQAKEVELTHKDSEISQLKTQLDEMRDQTRDMVSDLQRQLTSTKAAADEAAQARPAAPKPSASFFEANPPSQPAQPLFDNAPKQLFNGDQQQQQQIQQPQQQQQQQQPQPQQQMQPQPQQPQQQQSQQSQGVSGSQSVIDDPMQTQAPAPVELAQAQGQASGSGATTLNQAMPSQAIPRPQVSAPTTPFAGATGSYGSGVRAQVFEVIVRQALAGAPWKEICAGPMQVNNISGEEVEAEVKRRQALLKK